MTRALTLRAGGIAVRPLRSADAPILLRWLTNPEVLAFYEGRDAVFTLERIREKFFPCGDALCRCIVEHEGAPVGYLQAYALDEADCREYGCAFSPGLFAMDQFIGEPGLWGRGIGRAFVSLVVRHLAEAGGARAVLLDPHEDNLRAVRCYESCGFRKVKRLPAHELHEGKLCDCWLMIYKADD